MTAHSTPQIFLAYAAQGPGLRCAMFYFAAGEDLFGWFTGPQGARLVADYFQVAGFHALREPRYAAGNRAMCRGLARVQEQFVREWLFYRSAPDARSRLASYERTGLPAGEVNLRFARLAKLTRTLPEWTYESPAFEPAVLYWLAARWPLDYRPRSSVIEMDADRFQRDAGEHRQHAHELLRRQP